MFTDDACFFIPIFIGDDNDNDSNVTGDVVYISVRW